MKTYTFEIDGHSDEYYLARDVQQFFKQPIYSEKVKEAIADVKEEINSRNIVFKNDTPKRKREVGKMELVLRILCRCSEKFPELQKEMFGE
jgi:hypothetical protein